MPSKKAEQKIQEINDELQLLECCCAGSDAFIAPNANKERYEGMVGHAQSYIQDLDKTSEKLIALKNDLADVGALVVSDAAQADRFEAIEGWMGKFFFHREMTLQSSDRKQISLPGTPSLEWEDGTSMISDSSWIALSAGQSALAVHSRPQLSMQCHLDRNAHIVDLTIKDDAEPQSAQSDPGRDHSGETLRGSATSSDAGSWIQISATAEASDAESSK